MQVCSFYSIDNYLIQFLISSTLFNVIDTNNDNTIDFNEFLFLAAIGNRTGSLDERLDIIFDL
jgi:Ca2+-binding EF-hand superfamily protein